MSGLVEGQGEFAALVCPSEGRDHVEELETLLEQPLLVTAAVGWLAVTAAQEDCSSAAAQVVQTVGTACVSGRQETLSQLLYARMT